MATEVFAIGDCAVSGKPPTAQVAYQQGWDVWMSDVLSFTQNVKTEMVGWVFCRVCMTISLNKTDFVRMRHSSFFHICRNSCLNISYDILPWSLTISRWPGKYLGRMFRLGREHQIADPQAAPFKYCHLENEPIRSKAEDPPSITIPSQFVYISRCF